MKHEVQAEVEGDGTTAQLCQWIHDLNASSIPPDVLERAKYLILDGVACGIVGARVPWSEQCTVAINAYEPEGKCSIFGYDEKYGPVTAAMLNGGFIQATELDDYHNQAPLHSQSVVLAPLFAASEMMKHKKQVNGHAPKAPNGMSFLVASVIGFEVGPRAGLALNGADMLSMGWHSGAVFGCPAAAAATSKLMDLSVDDTESAIGIACTQACGLMSAQYEGMVKRLHHGFSARNGLLGTMLASAGYTGIKKVFERPYGGFLTMFSKGSTKEPKYKVHEVVKDLGHFWHTRELIRVKLHASCAGGHGLIECLEQMQLKYPDRFATEKLDDIKSIKIAQSMPVYAHNGWLPDERPITSTGGQMCAAYIGATQLVDRQVLLRQYAEHLLDRDNVWDLVNKSECYHDEYFDTHERICGSKVNIEFNDGFKIEDVVESPKGYNPPTTNEQIVDKYRKLVNEVIDKERAQQIEDLVLSLEKLEDVTALTELLGKPARNPLGKY